MAISAEDIPAFPMWKMFYDTIKLLELEYTESKIEHLAKIVKSQNLSHVFIYNTDEIIPHERYKLLYQKYKAFTIWLLGKFFYLSSLNNLSRIHELVTNVQLKILHLISFTQLDMCNEITSEYSNTLILLNRYKEGEKLELNIFKVVGFEDLKEQMQLDSLKIVIESQKACTELKKTLLIFMHHILVERFELHVINDEFIKYLDAVIYILKEDHIELKLNVLEIYKKCLETTLTRINDLSLNVLERFDTILALFESFLYEICNSRIKVDENYFRKIENIFIVVLKNKSHSCDSFKLRMSNFIINKICFDDSNDLNVMISEELQIMCCRVMLQQETMLESIFRDKWTTDIVNKSIVIALQLLAWKILRDFQEFEPLNPACIVNNISAVWSGVSAMLKGKLQQHRCNGNCELEKTLSLFEKITNMIIAIKIQLDTTLPMANFNLEFFNDTEFIILLLSYVNFHITNCKSTFPHSILVRIIMRTPIFINTRNIEIVFHLIAYQFLTLFYKTNNELPVNLYGRCDKLQARETVKETYKNLAFLQENKNVALRNVCEFLCVLESGLTNTVDDINRHNLEMNFVRIFSEVYTKRTVQLQSTLSGYIPIVISYCKSIDFVPRLLLHMCNSDSPEYMVEILPITICLLCSNYVRIVKFCDKEKNIKIQYECVSCDFKGNNNDENVIKQTIIKSQNPETPLIVSDVITGKITNINLNDVFKTVWKLSKTTNVVALTKFIKVLLPLSAHISAFHSEEIAKDWLIYMSHLDNTVRMEFSGVLRGLLIASQENGAIPNSTRSGIVRVCLDQLFKATKNSLQYSNYELQYTLLETIDQINELKVKPITLEVMRMLLYFIMIPTSKHSAIAENYFLTLAKKHNTKPLLLYGKYRRDICQYVVDLCAINQALVRYSMSKSLESVSLVLGFLSANDFLCKESSYLMPYLVALIVKMPEVLKLIEEVVELTDGDLLANNYGGIFIYLFLNKTEKEFKDCMKYIESKTGLTAPTLRKRNFKIILNELLLNFHEKRDRVLIALKLLATEDTDGDPMQITRLPDYLQPRFLGVLQYFDTKLFARKQVLLSLAEIFKFMGPKRMAPFRFKIIAMLRTALNLKYGSYPELNCNVWEAFVRNCDIECLGGQLAVIFVSLLTLIDSYSDKINAIFSYLILQNENLLKEYIPDLFFVLDYNVAPEIQNVIRKYVEKYENKSFSERLKYFAKYLTHETNEVKIHALRYLKRLAERNRSELDQMILGYNGMDATIVEILEILTVGCRDKDKLLKLACGECMGEFGAIEPSHLPRKCTEAQTFTFFMTEDAFITSSLQELIRALQAEKNTTIMDRFALAIQETLKIYGISPETSAPKHAIWASFPQSQKELMVPFLSSRYTMGQVMEPVTYSPIYGSNGGNTFQTWSQNWTFVLISTIQSEKKNLLEVCFPSMKQSHRTLMHFLPHILLHSLLEGSPDDSKRCHAEFMAIIRSFEASKATSVDDNRSENLPHSERPSEFLCVKVIFVLLDFLDRWMREWQWQKGAQGREDENYKKISVFMSKFCKLQLAKCSFECEEHSRALMYLEDYIATNPDELDKHLFLLAKINAELGEPDAVSGVVALQNKEPTLEQRILELEVSGKLSDAAACYERIPPPLKLQHLQGLIQCYLDLDNVNTAFNFTEGAIGKHPEYEGYLLEMQAEPLWRLGRYEDLNKLVGNPNMTENTSWGVKLGQALLQIQNGERNEFNDTLKFLRSQQVDQIGATSLEEGVYQHGYGSIVKLHSLNELEQVEKIIYELLARANDHKAVETIIKELSTEWELRIKVVQESTKIIEPILCIRRVALNQAKRVVKDKVPAAVPFIDSLLGESWLFSAKIARRAGVHQQAYTYTLKAEEYSPPKLFIERAKLHWLREEYQQAFTILTIGVEKLSNELSNDAQDDKRRMCAKAKLLIATYNDKISNVDTEVNIAHYKNALEMNKEWEKSYVSLAQYYDKLFQTYTEDERDSKASDIQIHMINYFGKSMLHGSNYIYQSMPRMLSIWFDYGTRLLEPQPPKDKDANVKVDRKHNLLIMTKLIDNCLQRLPSYMFLTAFSQIISRICHPQREVYIELKSIIIKLLLEYPQQTMWMMISVIRSSYSIRSKRCAEILGDPKLREPAMAKLVTDFTKLADKLIELCNKDIPETVNVTNINTLFRSLPRLLTKSDFSEIMIPTQKFRKLILPNPYFKSGHHNPFPNHYVHIVGVEDEVVILQSLQRPRKITFRGSDGKRYIQMLKPKDDLRKDFRLMEFNDIVNQMLSKDSNSRQRRLNIRLYSVAPLNEECGLIEWIPNLVGLRPVLMAIYKQKGQVMRARELKEAACNLRDPLAKKRDIFEKKLLPRHPPVLNEWFHRTFPDVQGWLAARTAYTRTTAVISMVGYILGLGDRHGENILLDSTNGDTVHVDFNCLFNKGETFEWPERVPFRLTHNMVAAMGPLEVEGIFRKSCACTLKVLRTHMDTLMSIVTPFVYDPLVSWPRNNAATSSVQNAERTNEQALEHVSDIRLRLQGVTKARGRSCSFALSVDGQINNIIEEARSVDNLCQMYIGWGGYL